ncbi:DNA polymerase III subunit chi [Rhodovulum sulfidophilum]|nr:DNA polymerase III subunit chi [Rhodovulum sulfidophilum]
MGQALFYHLTRRPLEDTLPMLLDKALKHDMRVAVRGSDRDRLARLDERLWMGDGFLPHGLAGTGFDADQPVLLTTGPEMPNGARCLMAVDGADVSPEETRALDRVCILFDGNDPAAVERARAQWRALTGAGLAAQYWSEETGRWQKKAESGG